MCYVNILGPPPLTRDVIEQIPTVAISQEQVDAKVQCSVCWEDFVLGENVRKLPCQHVYHENCICPWLELHGTCPICRQNLSPGGDQADARTPNAGAHRDFNPFSSFYDFILWFISSFIKLHLASYKEGNTI